MVAVTDAPTEVLINPKATYELIPGTPAGLTVNYPPEAGAKIYFTFIRPENSEETARVMEARLERISLNLNGVPATTLHNSADDSGHAVLVVARGGTQTPVQLLADTPDGIVSATAFIDNPGASWAYDSIAPLIKVLSHDMAKSIKGINFEENP